MTPIYFPFTYISKPVAKAFGLKYLIIHVITHIDIPIYFISEKNYKKA